MKNSNKRIQHKRYMENYSTDRSYNSNPISKLESMIIYNIGDNINLSVVSKSHDLASKSVYK